MTKEPLRILHITRLIGKRSFGVGPVVLGLALGQKAAGHHVEVWCQDAASEIAELTATDKLASEIICSFPHIGHERLGYSPSMEKEISARANDFDIVHQHGLWTAIMRVTNIWQEKTRRKTVIAPHGTLAPWALRKSPWKKRLSLWLYGRKNLSRAGAFHALSTQEATDIRQFGMHQPIAVIPNGISDDWLQNQGDRERFLQAFSLQENERIMLFLGRITPIKGLPMFIQALYESKDILDGWRLIIAGVDEFGHEREVRALVEQLDMKQFVHFVGPLYGKDKQDAFAAAQLFVLPSHSEGAPIVILEALGAGTPVLTTKASPWQELVTHNCGWRTDISVKALANTLQDALYCSESELTEMGKRGKELISEKYTWSRIAERTLELYTQLLNGGETPDFVITE